MQKIPTLFERGDDYMITDIMTEECLWVYEDPSKWTASIKWDGTACAVRKGRLFRRHHLKMDKPIPVGWVHWTGRPAQEHGHGWLPVREDEAQDVYHLRAWRHANEDLSDGTYELVGFRIQGNPYGLQDHTLWKHGHDEIKFDGARLPFSRLGWAEWFNHATSMEGVVFKHNGGPMAKIKAKDVGVRWPLKGKK